MKQLLLQLIMSPVSLMETQIFNSVLQLLHAQTIRYPLLILHKD